MVILIFGGLLKNEGDEIWGRELGKWGRSEDSRYVLMAGEGQGGLVGRGCLQHNTRALYATCPRMPLTTCATCRKDRSCPT